MEPSTSPVTDKLSGYAMRLRDLINEAYADGVVLTVPVPEVTGTTLPLNDGEGIFRFGVVIPSQGPKHLQLAKPTSAIASAVVVKGSGPEPESIIPPVYLPEPSNPLKMVPVYRPESAHCFADPEVVTPWLEDGIMTSALKFNYPMDLLALSNSEDLLNAGVIDNTDSIDSDIWLEKLFYQTTEGKVISADISYQPYARAVPPVRTNTREMEIDMVLKLNRTGAPLVGAESSECFGVVIAGRIHLEMGTCCLQVRTDDPGIKMLGFTLHAGRYNFNRIPHPFAQASELRPRTKSA